MLTVKQGKNHITRSSTMSSIAIPFEQTFRNLDENRPASTDAEATKAFNFCGCGWPEHMMVPKGVSGGFNMDLFVMVSDYEFDKVKK